VDDIRQRYHDVMNDLAEHPRIFAPPGSGIPYIVTYSHIKFLTFSVLYSQQSYFLLYTFLNLLYSNRLLPPLFTPDMAALCSVDLSVLPPIGDGGLFVLCGDQKWTVSFFCPSLFAMFRLLTFDITQVDDDRSALDEMIANMTKASSFGDVV
jgi:hypothetical protein